MSLIQHEMVFRGNLSSLGPFNSQLVADCLVTGNVVAIYFKASGVTNFTDSWFFGLKVNGTNVLFTTDRPQITSGVLNPSKTGLSIPVVFRDQFQPTVDARGLGSVNGPVTCIIVVDDGVTALDTTAIHAATSKGTPINADEIPILDSAASYGLAKLTWQNLKATLKTYFDTLYQPLAANLTALAGLISASNKIPYFTGSGTAGMLDLDTDPTLAAASNTKIAPQGAVKTYVDSVLNGLSWKQMVRASTTANGTLATAFANGQVIDGVTLVTGDRILIKDQSTASQNGIYVVAASGAPTRSTDADAGAELVNASVFVSEGTLNGDTQWTCTTNAPITPGSTSLTFAQVGGSTSYTADGTTLQLVGSQFSIKNSGVDTTQLNNGAVTLGKMANLAANSIMGNNTGSSATPLALSASQVRSLLALVIGTNVQAWDADLDTWATVTPGTNVGTILAKAADGSVVDSIGSKGIPQNSKSAAYTTVMADSGKHIYHPASDANARTFTIDSNANVAYPIGTAITFVNRTSQVVSIAITTDTMTLAGTTTTGTRSLAQNGVATAIKVETTEWVISGTGIT